MRILLILSLTLLVSCGRPLTPSELAFINTYQGPDIDASQAFLADGLRPPSPRTVPVRPRLTCQQRIYPPIQGPTARVSTQALTAFRQVYFDDRLYTPDFMSQYPDRVYLPDAMLLAHEMVHVWQWQNREITGYHPLKAALEHTGGRDPYLFDPETNSPFLSFAYEQQGAIMEEYLCCKALAPDSPRTSRLHAMLSEHFALPPISQPLATEIYLPWQGVTLDGICDGPA
ncbi:hypothetical protein [Flavimaricola marinus]|uniref:DUF4157 domain-containing protein n=1 Tax=Flavimaricola marinus TaxID=1819565 RepID=A0A238LGH0_9RHOB|nr:hypothetical protein [Flavimaricola marinus]SMY08505.1 hypothetical protein LOM8899_02658 [Flavimaricola marinus]